MKKLIYIFFILGIITSLYAYKVHASNSNIVKNSENIEIINRRIFESIETDEVSDYVESTEGIEFVEGAEVTESVEKNVDDVNSEDLSDNYYLIFVNNTSDEISTPSDQDQERQERQDSNDFIHSMVSEIHNLIIGNKNTYKDPSKLKEMDENTQMSKNRKKDGEVKYLLNYDDYSNYVYPISTVNERTVLYAYLSSDLVDTVKSLPNIIDCVPNRRFKFDSHYTESDILQETGWNKLKVRENADLHLSILSQGKYSEDLIGQYDTNYYYPGAAGQDIDVFIFDTGFNFRHQEFSNSDERTSKCAFGIQKGKIVSSSSSTVCNTADLEKYNNVHHGEMVADVVGGKQHGVARKANLYGIIPEGLDYQDEANVIAGLQYIKDHLLRPNKAVFNFSFGEYYDINNDSIVITHWQSLINEITKMGAVFVTSAGNNGTPVIDKGKGIIKYPCAFDSMICVGGIDNSSGGSKNMHSYYYYRANASNYGHGVDLYAPAYVNIAYRDSYGRDREGFVGGTSFSSPIVAGVVATIMSDNRDIKFNTNTMIDYLSKIGERNAVKGLLGDGPNILVNNGKHTVYSLNGKYYGCGIYSGRKKCASSQCCSANGNCKSSSSSSCTSKEGCQINYGTCKKVTSTVEGRCGNGYGSCHSKYCCSASGYCGKTSEYCSVGCQSNFGICN
ncbi:subtilisin-like protein [Neocallimastix californiae]|uniref:Subtilisin-like protein n=1 Tax=Neocallimastix californiae TaxID=1754190 RepID=A0A1Y2EUW2_9FUNG|nr:subtilisin-like protein [Neocallimastix californiae]|eukprot:ORY74946.1 subtilisin-like protein [Neocallimastix californiae]